MMLAGYPIFNQLLFAVADPRGRPPLRTKIFLISCSFLGGNLANFYVGAPSWRVGAPSYEETWIRPWFVR